jgi:hypothetical protein
MGEKYMVERRWVKSLWVKSILVESLWVKNLWGNIGVEGMLAFVPPFSGFVIFLGWPISTNVAEVKPRPAFLFLKFSDAVQTVTKLVLFACHSA